MDKGKLTNKNSTFEEFKNAVKDVLVSDYSCTNGEADRLVKDEVEDIKYGYSHEYLVGSIAWGLSLLAE